MAFAQTTGNLLTLGLFRDARQLSLLLCDFPCRSMQLRDGIAWSNNDDFSDTPEALRMV